MLAAPVHAGAQQVALDWNDIAQRLVVALSPTAVEQTRLMAIVHVAMHDAVNAVTGKYELHTAVPDMPAGISADAAAVGAAHGVLTRKFGAHPQLATGFAASLAALGISAGDPGVVFGDRVAEAIYASREADGSSAAAYAFVPDDAGAPGVWAPIGAQTSQLPGWGGVTPFVLRSAAQFRPDPPPALDSKQYARDYNEVLLVGAATSATRTAEQSAIAQFWRASPTALWNPILRRALIVRGNDLSSTVRIMAVFYLAAADASIACWEAKYHYNFWRPEPAIVGGEDDGNADTSAVAGWRPYVSTPPHPDYVSGHAANSGAMAFVLASIFGDEPGYIIAATSPQPPGFVRYWNAFSDGVAEVIDARVYSGIHFRTADVVGARLGRQVAQFVLRHALKETRPR
jgi:hypothetical protein